MWYTLDPPTSHLLSCEFILFFKIASLHCLCRFAVIIRSMCQTLYSWLDQRLLNTAYCKYSFFFFFKKVPASWFILENSHKRLKTSLVSIIFFQYYFLFFFSFLGFQLCMTEQLTISKPASSGTARVKVQSKHKRYDSHTELKASNQK